jgi:hypothetical protein
VGLGVYIYTSESGNLCRAPAARSSVDEQRRRREAAMGWGLTEQAAKTGAKTGDRPQYLTEVNKGSINMGKWQEHLNEMHEQGYRLAHVFEQDKNTVQVFELRA